MRLIASVTVVGLATAACGQRVVRIEGRLDRAAPGTRGTTPMRSPRNVAPPSVRLSAQPLLQRFAPARGCQIASGNRPAILQAFFHSPNHKFDDGDWTYRDALHAMRGAGVPLDWMLSNDGRGWNGFAFAYGDLGEIRHARRRLERTDPPRDLSGPTRDDLAVWCEGDEANIGRIAVELPPGLDVGTVVQRHGSRETVMRDRTLDLDDTVFWYLRADPSTVIQRTIAYMMDHDVISAYPDSDVEYGAEPGQQPRPSPATVP